MIQIQRKVVFSGFTQPLPPTLKPPPCIHHVINSCSFVSLQVRKIGRSFAQAHFRLWRNKCGHHQLVGRGGWMDTFATVYIIYIWEKHYARRLAFYAAIWNEMILDAKSFGSKCTKYYYSRIIYLQNSHNLFAVVNLLHVNQPLSLRDY